MGLNVPTGPNRKAPISRRFPAYPDLQSLEVAGSTPRPPLIGAGARSGSNRRIQLPRLGVGGHQSAVPLRHRFARDPAAQQARDRLRSLPMVAARHGSRHAAARESSHGLRRPTPRALAAPARIKRSRPLGFHRPCASRCSRDAASSSRASWSTRPSTSGKQPPFWPLTL